MSTTVKLRPETSVHQIISEVSDLLRQRGVYLVGMVYESASDVLSITPHVQDNSLPEEHNATLANVVSDLRDEYVKWYNEHTTEGLLTLESIEQMENKSARIKAMEKLLEIADNSLSLAAARALHANRQAERALRRAAMQSKLGETTTVVDAEVVTSAISATDAASSRSVDRSGKMVDSPTNTGKAPVSQQAGSPAVPTETVDDPLSKIAAIRRDKTGTDRNRRRVPVNDFSIASRTYNHPDWLHKAAAAIDFGENDNDNHYLSMFLLRAYKNQEIKEEKDLPVFIENMKKAYEENTLDFAPPPSPATVGSRAADHEYSGA